MKFRSRDSSAQLAQLAQLQWTGPLPSLESHSGAPGENSAEEPVKNSSHPASTRTSLCCLTPGSLSGSWISNAITFFCIKVKPSEMPCLMTMSDCFMFLWELLHAWRGILNSTGAFPGSWVFFLFFLEGIPGKTQDNGKQRMWGWKYSFSLSEPVTAVADLDLNTFQILQIPLLFPPPLHAYQPCLTFRMTEERNIFSRQEWHKFKVLCWFSALWGSTGCFLENHGGNILALVSP